MLRSRSSFANRYLSAANNGTVQRRDSFLRLVGIRHFDEPKAPGAVRYSISDHACGVNDAVDGEGLSEPFFLGVETEVTYE